MGQAISPHTPLQEVVCDLRRWNLGALSGSGPKKRKSADIHAKLIKAIFAIRNRNGGFLLIGFDNATMKPDLFGYDQSVETLYHVDAIQGLVSRFASSPFEVSVFSVS